MPLSTLEFKAIGTSWKIDLESPDKKLLEVLRELISDRIEIFDKAYSRFRKDSIVSEIKERAGKYELPADAVVMFNLYQKLYEITKGKVTPLIGQVLIDAGYDESYSLKSKENIPKAKAWKDVMEYKQPFLTIKEPVALDFGALGKGYLIDIVSEIIEDQGIKKYTINAGGDILVCGQTLRIGLEDPDNFENAVGTADIKDQSIAGSAGNRRAWGKFHHIIDPELVASPKHIKALWVVAETTLLADGLATALFFTKPEELLSHFNFEYAILHADRSAQISKSFPGTFFSD